MKMKNSIWNLVWVCLLCSCNSWLDIKLIVVTPDFRSSVTIFYSSSNGYELSVAGIKGFGDDALDTFWIKSDMHIGESIEIDRRHYQE